jgi:hypothetical protein
LREIKQTLPLTDFIKCDIPLEIAFEGINVCGSLCNVLGATALNPFTPHPERRSFHISPHDGNYLAFRALKLFQNGIERCSVFPGHFYNSVYFFLAELIDVIFDLLIHVSIKPDSWDLVFESGKFLMLAR